MKLSKQTAILFLSLFLMLVAFVQASASSSTKALQYIPVQDGGRVKPFQTFANEKLELIYGKTKYEGKPAYELLMTWLLQPGMWSERPIFEIKHHLVKKALGIEAEAKYVSLEFLLKTDKLEPLLQELSSKRESKEKLDPYFQAIERLEGQIVTFREVASGAMFRVWPNPESDSWKSLIEIQGAPQEAFLRITKAFVAVLPENASKESGDELENSVKAWTDLAMTAGQGKYADLQRIKLEIHYNDFHPFRWAWVSYFLAVVSLVLFWILKTKPAVTVAWAFSWVGLALHLYGFVLRSYITGRAPVANMYETVVWVSFGAMIFAMVIEFVYKWKIVLAAGASVAGFCLILSDMAPTVLDPSLHPLEPVLRSNFWLTVHVMTITVSYAAFFLAFALGDAGLVFYLLGEKKHEARISAIVLALYRAIQIGVAFLAPGIILGGVWADYSWGRFWGWDPKETWALIALLGYLAVLHARLAGLIKNFGMVCTAVVTFALVIMAWYGVNFVLGAGLHSYGFGAGGVEYVTAFVLVHLLFVLFVSMIRRGKTKKKA